MGKPFNFYFAEEILNGKIVYLGQSQDRYLAQQSLRTMTNLQHPEKPYIKLSMSLTNTSSSRVLAKHTVMNGPIITDWLQRLLNRAKPPKSLILLYYVKCMV